MKNLPFVTDPRLSAEFIKIADLHVSEVRLKADGDNDWFVLVPKIPNLKDLIDLNPADEKIVYSEIRFLAELLREHSKPDKLNIASLGNQVQQLHIHIIARYTNDRAWPNPIWGTPARNTFDDKKVQGWIEIINKTKMESSGMSFWSQKI